MKHRVLFLLGIAVSSLVGVVACVGDAPTTTPPTTNDAAANDAAANDTGTAADAGPPDVAPVGCPAGCLPLAPAGWIGPSAVFDGPTAKKPTACPNDTYTQKELDGLQGVSSDPAVCNCGAPTFQGASCTAVAVDYYSDSTCTNAQLNLGTWANGDCKAPGSTPNGYVKFGTPTLADAGTCAFPNPTKTVPAPSYTAENVSCGSPSATTCPANAKCAATPVPAAPFNRVCIHQDGDVACPAVAEYQKRFVTYRNLDDTRACSACTGTAAAAGCTMAWVAVGNTLQCQSVASYPNVAGSSCVPSASAKVFTTTTTTTNRHARRWAASRRARPR